MFPAYGNLYKELNNIRIAPEMLIKKPLLYIHTSLVMVVISHPLNTLTNID